MTKVIKKVLSVLMAVAVIAAVFAGCSSNSSNNDNSSSERASKDTAKFAVVAMDGSNGAFKDMADGIIDELVAKGYKKDNIVFKDAQGDATSLSTIINSLDDGSYSAILTVGTQATQTLVNIKSETPCFFCAVSAPVQAGVITDMNKPDKFATGTSNAIPVSDIVKMGLQITPNVKKWGLIYSESQVNAKNTVDSAVKYFKEIGAQYEIATVDTANDVKSSTEILLKKGCDAVFVPNDQIVQQGVESLVAVCNEAGVPTYCSSATTVKSGCLATLAIDDKGIGAKTADMCVEYMQCKALEDIPSIVVSVDYCTYNSTTAAALQKANPTLKLVTPTEKSVGQKINEIK